MLDGKIGTTMKAYKILPGAKMLLRLGVKLSPQAKLRLKWIDWYFAHGQNKRLTCRHFGISPTTFYKWLERYNPRNLLSLESHSRKPRRARQSGIAQETMNLVISLRKKNMALSKYKLSYLLFRDQGVKLSASSVGRILKTRGLIEEARVIRGIERRKQFKYRIPRLRVAREARYQAPGHLVQLDTKHLVILGQKYYQFIAIDTKSRLAFGKVYTAISSTCAKDFLDRLQKHFPFKIKAIQTDNGSEYLLYFHQECRKRKIIHYFSRARTPKDNALVERLIQSTKYELWLFDDQLLPELPYLNQKLTWWVGWYNTYRPHQSLNYLTPAEYYQSLQKDSSPLSVKLERSKCP